MRKKIPVLSVCRVLVFVLLCFIKVQGQEVLFSTLDHISRPEDFSQSISTITNNEKVILADDFALEQKSKITKFKFIGQFGVPALESEPLFLGGHLFVFDDSSTGPAEIPFSAIPKAYFYMERNAPGLTMTREDDKTLFSVDLGVAEKELVLEGGTTYWVAFVPVLDADGLSESQVWYWWYTSGGEGFEPKRWEMGAERWTTGKIGISFAFSIEGQKVKLGGSDFDVKVVPEKVFPNPTDGVFTITSGEGIVLTEVYNITGQLLLKGNSDTIDLSTYPKGTYLVVITHKDGHKSNTKLIKE